MNVAFIMCDMPSLRGKANIALAFLCLASCLSQKSGDMAPIVRDPYVLLPEDYGCNEYWLDVNGDGLPELFLRSTRDVNTRGERCRIYK